MSGEVVVLGRRAGMAAPRHRVPVTDDDVAALIAAVAVGLVALVVKIGVVAVSVFRRHSLVGLEDVKIE